jgi:hypothetical protein
LMSISRYFHVSTLVSKEIVPNFACLSKDFVLTAKD